MKIVAKWRQTLTKGWIHRLFVSRIDVSFFIGRTFVNEWRPFLESFKKCGKSNDAQKMTFFRKNASKIRHHRIIMWSYPFKTRRENSWKYPLLAYKYRFGLQKGVKNQKYLFNFGKYNVSAFQRTFDRLHIFRIGEVTSD